MIENHIKNKHMFYFIIELTAEKLCTIVFYCSVNCGI